MNKDGFTTSWNGCITSKDAYCIDVNVPDMQKGVSYTRICNSVKSVRMAIMIYYNVAYV